MSDIIHGKKFRTRLAILSAKNNLLAASKLPKKAHKKALIVEVPREQTISRLFDCCNERGSLKTHPKISIWRYANAKQSLENESFAKERNKTILSNTAKEGLSLSYAAGVITFY